MTVLKYKQFINESTVDSLPKEYEESIEYVSDMMKQDEAPSKEIINTMKKLKGHEGNTAIIGDWGAVDDYNKVKKDLKKLNIKFIESKDDNGNFVAFLSESLNEALMNPKDAIEHIVNLTRDYHNINRREWPAEAFVKDLTEYLEKYVTGKTL